MRASFQSRKEGPYGSALPSSRQKSMRVSGDISYARSGWGFGGEATLCADCRLAYASASPASFSSWWWNLPGLGDERLLGAG